MVMVQRPLFKSTPRLGPSAWGCFHGLSLAVQRQAYVRFTGDCKLEVDVNGWLSLCVSDRGPVKAANCNSYFGANQ